MMSSTRHANDSYEERNSITELLKASCKNALGDDSTGIEDDDFLEDQELVDSYEFVEDEIPKCPRTRFWTKGMIMSKPTKKVRWE
ncbi:hypothetical protein AA0119_g1468 [Alternaria tenuissima]|uniref:PiggyBac transposable element-derived protein domain-containing protein n=1 Tax=Alternaria tenuissima TaxID=119927 RepID=A0AB37WVL4_9PLEO|nr:hypothetical protein AA0115_g2441 [Alternaria tenuissima]RYO08842.1 hypothetical protein AA0119_g1468 [Alternaria tenuissima]RYO22416.1 hypothetical protein AA0121_g2252 [Alternaria tenuissima]